MLRTPEEIFGFSKFAAFGHFEIHTFGLEQMQMDAKINSNQPEQMRCGWCLKDELYINYHDREWGIPSRDDQHLFEHLILETFQAGLSWYTILKKRESFREAFAQFNAINIAAFTEEDVQRLMNDTGIIRNRQKIMAAINNARQYLRIKAVHGTFSDYIWQFTGNKILTNNPRSLSDLVATSKESDAMSKQLKADGFKFVGSTTCYAFMQAVGMVNDHLVDCWKKGV